MFSDDDFEVIGYLICGFIVLVLSANAPEFIANSVGYGAELRELIKWAQTQPNWVFVPLCGLYLLIGFFSVVVAGSALVALGYLLFKGISAAAVRLWDAVHQLTIRIAYICCRLVSSTVGLVVLPLQLFADFARNTVISLARRVTRPLTEAQELHRIYREEYRDQFRSFWEFKAAFDAANGKGRKANASAGTNDGGQRKRSKSGNGAGNAPDAFAQAMRLFGLPANFSREDLKRRYRELIRKAHPDAGGSHAKASAINRAHNLIKKRKGWA